MTRFQLATFGCLCLLQPTSLIAQWSTDPANNLVVGYGLLPEIASDSAGGCYITYEQNLAYPRRLMLERLNRYGYKPWGTSRRILSEFPEQSDAKLTEDGHGGVIVTYTDRMSDSTYAQRLRVQRIDSSGNFLWGPTGIRVSLSETNQGVGEVVSDGAGGCIVAWSNTVNIDTVSEEYHHRINRISSAGVPLWGDSGKFVWNYGYQPPGRPLMVGDGRGDCYLMVGDRGVQRFDSQGNTYWTNSVRVPTGGRILRVDRDGNLYLFGARYIGYNGQMIFSIHLQKVDTSGTLLWDSLGVTLDTLNTNLFLNYGFAHQSGYSYVVWPQNIGGVWDLRAQLVRNNGTIVFAYGGIPVSQTVSEKVIVGVQPSDSLTSIFVWDDTRPIDGTYAQKLDSLGRRRWDTSDVLASYSQPMKVVTDGNDGFVAIVSGQNFAVRAQQVNKSGELGRVITFVKNEIDIDHPRQAALYQNYPNPFNGQTTIRFELPRTMYVMLALYNLLGQNVGTLLSGQYPQGSHSVVVESDHLPSGTYFYRLATPQMVLSQKLIILK
jgi:hypothetical protein